MYSYIQRLIRIDAVQYYCTLKLLDYIINLTTIRMDSSYTSSRTKPLYRGTQIVWYVLGIIEILLAFRFVLKLIGANPAAGFSSFIYNISYFFAAPFLNVVSTTKVSGSAFEWTTLLAMLVYWVVALGIIKLFLMSKTVSTPESAEKLNQEEIV